MFILAGQTLELLRLAFKKESANMLCSLHKFLDFVPLSKDFCILFGVGFFLFCF